METLVYQQCERCTPESRPVSIIEKTTYSKEIPYWSIQKFDNIEQLVRHFPMSNYTEAVELANNISDLAERQGHHPSIETETGNVTVKWWSHQIAGLHKNDFIMAAKTDRLYRSFSKTTTFKSAA